MTRELGTDRTEKTKLGINEAWALLNGNGGWHVSMIFLSKSQETPITQLGRARSAVIDGHPELSGPRNSERNSIGISV